MSRARHLADVEIFCHAAETGRFAATAAALGLPPSSVSRAVARLEARLGAPLFTRTTRRIRLTAEGEAYHREAGAALRAIEEADAALARGQGAPRGRFRLALPTTFGHQVVLPRIPAFLAAHPGIALEVHVTNRVIDLVEEGFDLVIRLGDQPPSGLLSRTLANGAIGVFASADYLRDHGAPEAPDDITRHRCVRLAYPGLPQPLDFVVMDAGRRRLIPPGPGPLVFEDPLGMITLGLAGAGLFQTGRYLLEAPLASGALVEVLQPWSGATRPIVALFPGNRRNSAKLRAFLDWFGKPDLA